MHSPSEPGSAPSERSLRWATWLDTNRVRVLAVSVVLVLLCGWLSSRLPVYGDFSWLLPPDAKSVRDLRALQQRVSSLGTLLIAVESDDAALRTRTAEQVARRLRTIDPKLVASVAADDAKAREFRWQNRFLFAPLADLQSAHDALSSRITEAKLKSNPLYVSFEDEDEAPAPKKDAKKQGADKGSDDKGSDDKASGDAPDTRIEELRTRMRDAEKKAHESAGLVSKDGKMQLLIVRTPFASSEVRLSRELMSAVRKAVQEACAEVGPGCSAPQVQDGPVAKAAAGPTVTVGLAGDVANGQAEQKSILSGMLLATVLTIVLVGLGLFAYYRSVRGVGALLWTLTVGTLLTFALTKLTIGHLNLATAFLSAIVVGNGINFGIVLLARYFEELRAGRPDLDALAHALGGTLKGTATAGLTAAVAYGSLIVTQFRGFRHFGIIGGMGMVACWVATYTVLPALLAVARRRGMHPRGEPKSGQALAKLYPSRTAPVALVSLALLLVSVLGAVLYLAHDPLERDFRNVRSSSAEILAIRDWLDKVDRGFGRGISGGMVIALPTQEAATQVAARLRAHDAGKQDQEKLFSRISTLEDQLPTDQPQKLALLQDIRSQMLQGAAASELSDEDRRLLLPPEGLRALTTQDVPVELAWPYTERDGTRGRIVLAGVGLHYNTWLAEDLRSFVNDFRKIDVQGAQVGGSTFVFADLLDSMNTDGPRATVASMVGATLVVLLMLGFSRHATITLLASLLGTTMMLWLCAVMGIKVNFLDFVALPITIGIGIDYAANLAARHQQTGESPRQLLSTVGGAVFLCSYTTIVGYGSLLISENQGLRSFGGAAILGEFTCLAAALGAVPALLTRLTASRR
ncbi:MMPL family transporter [Aggregicoccus sp. 17bor-14]|uniref:efflux RND transporter permease subunit n=1 Tax=Myxococcaceae TaxID=31 RepID=UPI00129C283D|nr:MULTISPECIES: MMPL family transporter [Myxococcaceae]MBF5044570.1 MMPL family transporter [Simulacricoccus sp. 17bor-14]MRI90315.1 MMPL family transporter [Aggregicoccus sp. 17bor-14]